MLAAAAPHAWVMWHWGEVADRMEYVDPFGPEMMLLAVLAIVTLLEATRRAVEVGLVWMIVVSLGYMAFGHYIPGLLNSRPFTPAEILDKRGTEPHLVRAACIGVFALRPVGRHLHGRQTAHGDGPEAVLPRRRREQRGDGCGLGARRRVPVHVRPRVSEQLIPDHAADEHRLVPGRREGTQYKVNGIRETQLDDVVIRIHHG